jgi:hypothetical protein
MSTPYKLYSSDSETDSESGSGSESDTSFTSDSSSSSYAEEVAANVPRNFRALADGLSMKRVGAAEHLDFSSAGSPLTTGFPTFKNYDIPKDPSGNEIKASSQNITSIIMLDSGDRDRNVFTQPTNVTLRLPRVYSNITNFQLIQIKLLSAFFYFRAAKNNLNLSILELGRTTTDTLGNIVDNIIVSLIREGTYNISSLLAEITTQLNITPLFYDFPNGFQDFAPRFAATGDYTINFNFPGDTYYDSLLNQFIPNPTALSIVQHYFKGQYAGYSSYTVDEIKIAYYYPVVKEVLLDNNFPYTLNLNIVTSLPYLLPGETVRSRCIYTFQGIDDPVVQEVIALNLNILDMYRVQHTFRYYLINKYDVTYEAQSNRVTFSSPSLNTSLVNLINYKQSQYFAEQLNAQGITSAQYTTFNTQNTILLAVLNDMFYFIEKWLAVYFGVNFNTYTLNYIANPTNYIPIRDAYQAVGISSNFDANVIARNIPPIDTSILAPLRVSAKPYWNRLTDLSNSTVPYPYNLETGNPSTSSNYPYSVLLEQQDVQHKFVDSNDYLYANRLTRYADILVPLDPTSYTVFKFRSPVRQTLQVETLPRPTKFRYPAYNAIAYDVSSQRLFDNSYCFIENAQNSAMDVSPTFAATKLATIPGFAYTYSTMNFGISYESSIQAWGSTTAGVQVGDTRKFFQMRTPLPTDYTSSLSAGYRYPMTFTLRGASNTSSFITPMNMYLYHDRGAFMADVSDVRMESPIHYLAMTSTNVSSTSVDITFPVYGNQTYYVLARSVDTAIATQRFQVVPWFPAGSNYTALTSTLSNFDPLADPQTIQALSNFNYAVNADPAYIRLPIQSSIQTSQTLDSLYSTLVFSTVAIGYDTNGVSTDLTDYCGFVAGAPSSNAEPNASLRIDPISGYGFQVGNGYNTVTQQYLTPADLNAVLYPNGGGLYTPSTVATRETTIVHWYGTTYLPNSENQPPMLSNDIADTTVTVPYTASVTNGALQSYTYAGSNNSLQFGDGVYGISFVPDQGEWDIQRMMFKSIYNCGDSNIDTNLNIRYLGVYFSAITTNRFVHEIPLSDAIAVLKFNKAVTYNSNSQNIGFDAAGGTYYEFIRDSNYPTGSNSYIYGYSQIRGTINTDVNSIYSFLPFDANGDFMTFNGLVGSPTPYPYYSDASAATVYYDGTSAPNMRGIVVPKVKTSPDTQRGPPIGYDQTQSQYEQSSPIGTNLLQYIVPYPFALLSNTIKQWDPLPYAPSMIIGDVSGYIMTQDSYYRIFQYQAATTDYTLVEKYQFTLDQVFPSSDPTINFIGVAANEVEYAFFAYSNVNTSANPALSNLIVVKTMDPFDGSIQDTYEIHNVPGFDPTSQEITNLTYNNYGGFTMGLQSASTFTAICKHTSNTSSMTSFTAIDLAGYNSTLNRLITRQSPKEQYGAFYVFPYRTMLGGPIPEGITDYISVTPSNILPQINPVYKYYSFTGSQDTFTSSTQPCQIKTYNLSNTGSNPTVFIEPIVSRAPYKDYLYMLSPYDPTRFYQVTTFTGSADIRFTSNAYTTQSFYQFPVNTSNLTQGANGSKWSVVGNILYGNRNDIIDAPRKIYQSWQLFYPVQRIVMKRISKNFTFMYNRDGLEYPEYPHTAIAGYDSLSSFMTDISHNWGLENASNFTVADFAFQGQTFNSFLFTMPLEKYTVQKPYYYLAVRNYSPTEKSQVLMRFSVTNLYDFGYVSMTDLSDEPLLLQTQSNIFNPSYYASLQAFNSNFIIGSNGRVFGSNVIAGYSGSNIANVTGFGDFYNRFVILYNQYNAQVQQVQTINNNVNADLTNFIQTDLQNILPPTSFNRQRFTDPLTYKILWKSALLPAYARLDDNWGLGWNLGFEKADTDYDTVHQGSSFFKILDDFINLQVNREFDMNRMDTGAKENLSQTLEPTGATKAFHAKLLLAPFGSYATTLVSNPISFYVPLGRMDKITFTWVDVTGATINNADCEWNAVIQIVEKKDITEYPQQPRIDPTMPH